MLIIITLHGHSYCIVLHNLRSLSHMIVSENILLAKIIFVSQAYLDVIVNQTFETTLKRTEHYFEILVVIFEMHSMKKKLASFLHNEKSKFPNVVTLKTETSKSKKFTVFLESRHPRKLKFAKIEVLDVTKNEDSKDPSVEVLRNTLHGRSFLFPVDFPCNVTPINRSFRRQSYSSISEVCDCIPNVLLLEDDAELPNVTEDASTFRPKGTRLSVIDVRRDDKMIKMMLSDEQNDKFLVKENNPLLFTAVLPTRKLKLEEFLKTSRLPRLVVFDAIPPERIVTDDANSVALIKAAFNGTVRIKEIVEQDLIIGWVKDVKKSKHAYKLLIIPASLATNIVCSEVKGPVEGDKEKLILSHFSLCSFEKLIQNRLFLLNPDMKTLTDINLTINAFNPNLQADPVRYPEIGKMETRQAHSKEMGLDDKTEAGSDSTTEQWKQGQHADEKGIDETIKAGRDNTTEQSKQGPHADEKGIDETIKAGRDNTTEQSKQGPHADEKGIDETIKAGRDNTTEQSKQGPHADESSTLLDDVLNGCTWQVKEKLDVICGNTRIPSYHEQSNIMSATDALGSEDGGGERVNVQTVLAGEQQ
ncbi:uncharacterized protein LOC128213034 [Mya arenaria]|uniref:uncharacterized protein LOC128213034 n=1 Tax=Mya arenaria TaxID=6604 RepID=UPI0022E26743|nr:uncharacterized protein LOC128213034 [Mya arenaria]